jgi:hypothetical protein
MDGEGHGSCSYTIKGGYVCPRTGRQLRSVRGLFLFCHLARVFRVILDQLGAARQGNVLGAGGQFPLFHWALYGYITAYT